MVLILLKEISLRERLSSMISQSFVEELEGSFRGNYKIGSEKKTTPKYLKKLANLADLYFDEDYNKKQKVSIYKIYPSYSDQNNNFAEAEKKFLFLSSVYLSINFSLTKETHTIFRKKILDSCNVFNEEFKKLRSLIAENSSKGGIATLDPDYKKFVEGLGYWSGFGIYWFRNILGMNRVYFSKKLNKGSSTGIYKIEKQETDFLFNPKIMTHKYWFECLDVLLKEANSLNKLDDFIFIISNLKIGQYLIEEAFDWFKSDEFKDDNKEKHLKALECIRKIRESNYKIKYLDSESTYSIRAAQFYWLQNIYGIKPDKLDSFDERIYIDSDSFSFIKGDALNQITKPMDTRAWILKKASINDPFDVDPSEYAQDSGEDDLLVSSFIFKEARERKDLNAESLFYHRLEDTSMESDFSSGDIIIIEKNDEYDGASKYYLLVFNNQFLIRKLIPSMEDRNSFLIKASNEDFPAMQLKNYDFDIYGKVIGSIKSNM